MNGDQPKQVSQSGSITAAASFVVLIVILCLVENKIVAQSPSQQVIQPSPEINTVLKAHCIECHGNDAPEGNSRSNGSSATPPQILHRKTMS